MFIFHFHIIPIYTHILLIISSTSTIIISFTHPHTSTKMKRYLKLKIFFSRKVIISISFNFLPHDEKLDVSHKSLSINWFKNILLNIKYFWLTKLILKKNIQNIPIELCDLSVLWPFNCIFWLLYHNIIQPKVFM